MEQYRIVSETYYNNYGKVSSVKYFVQKLGLTWLFKKPIWRFITHREGDTTGTYIVNTEFKSQEDAKVFIDDILCKGKPVHATVFDIISFHTCN